MRGRVLCALAAYKVYLKLKEYNRVGSIASRAGGVLHYLLLAVGLLMRAAHCMIHAAVCPTLLEAAANPCVSVYNEYRA